MAIVTIIGAGMMGSALAFPARENGHEVRLVGTHLDEAIIEAMKQRHAEKRLRDEALRQADAVADGEIVDWQEVQKQWDEYYAQHPEEAENK